MPNGQCEVNGSNCWNIKLAVNLACATTIYGTCTGCSCLRSLRTDLCRLLNTVMQQGDGITLRVNGQAVTGAPVVLMGSAQIHDHGCLLLMCLQCRPEMSPPRCRWQDSSGKDFTSPGPKSAAARAAVVPVSSPPRSRTPLTRQKLSSL